MLDALENEKSGSGKSDKGSFPSDAARLIESQSDKNWAQEESALRWSKPENSRESSSSKLASEKDKERYSNPEPNWAPDELERMRQDHEIAAAENVQTQAVNSSAKGDRLDAGLSAPPIKSDTDSLERNSNTSEIDWRQKELEYARKQQAIYEQERNKDYSGKNYTDDSSASTSVSAAANASAGAEHKNEGSKLYYDRITAKDEEGNKAEVSSYTTNIDANTSQVSKVATGHAGVEYMPESGHAPRGIFESKTSSELPQSETKSPGFHAGVADSGTGSLTSHVLPEPAEKSTAHSQQHDSDVALSRQSSLESGFGKQGTESIKSAEPLAAESTRQYAAQDSASKHSDSILARTDAPGANDSLSRLDSPSSSSAGGSGKFDNSHNSDSISPGISSISRTASTQGELASLRTGADFSSSTRVDTSVLGSRSLDFQTQVLAGKLNADLYNGFALSSRIAIDANAKQLSGLIDHKSMGFHLSLKSPGLIADDSSRLLNGLMKNSLGRVDSRDLLGLESRSSLLPSKLSSSERQDVRISEFTARVSESGIKMNELGSTRLNEIASKVNESGSRLTEPGLKLGEFGSKGNELGVKAAEAGVKAAEAAVKAGEAAAKIGEFGAKLGEPGHKGSEMGAKLSDLAAAKLAEKGITTDMQTRGQATSLHLGLKQQDRIAEKMQNAQVRGIEDKTNALIHSNKNQAQMNDVDRATQMQASMRAVSGDQRAAAHESNKNSSFTSRSELQLDDLSSEERKTRNILEAMKVNALLNSENKRYFTGIEISLMAAMTLAGAAKLREKQETEEFSTKDSSKQILHRRQYLVKENDTLESVADEIYGDKDVSWLIAEINIQNLDEHFVEGLRVIELKTRQILELPDSSEVMEFLRLRPAARPEQTLVSFVSSDSIDRELLESLFMVVGGQASPTTDQSKSSVWTSKSQQTSSGADSTSVKETSFASAPIPLKALPKLFLVDDDKLNNSGSGILNAIATAYNAFCRSRVQQGIFVQKEAAGNAYSNA